jgi:cellulose synthase/poly-beta-1,6-N-acetylglucosamine synthase-like glycosyltransferase
VVSEDLDIAVKTLLKNKEFKYTEKVEVYTKAPSSWRSWLAQRKRWGIGAGLWLRKHGRNLIKYVKKISACCNSKHPHPLSNIDSNAPQLCFLELFRLQNS